MSLKKHRSPSAPFSLCVDWLTVLVFFAIIWFCAKCWGATDAAKRAANAVCKVSTADLSQGGEFSGSGILVEDANGDGQHYVLTAAHVVRGGDQQNVRCEWWNGSQVRGVVAGANSRVDCAIIRISSKPQGIAGAHLRCQPIQPGDSLLFLGYARGQDLVIRESRMRGWLTSGGSGVASGTSIPGMSGGPVIDDQGHVIGPLWGSGGDLPNETAFVTVAGRSTVLTANY